MKNWKWHEQLNSQVRLVDFQEIGGRADEVYYEQQKHITCTDSGFEIAEKFHQQMKMQMSAFLTQMDLHTKSLTKLEDSIVEYHKKTITTYKDIALAEKENVRRIEKKLENVAGDMAFIKDHVFRILIKLNKMDKDKNVDENES